MIFVNRERYKVHFLKEIVSKKEKDKEHHTVSTHRAREEKNRCIQRELQVVPEYSHFVECPVFCYIIENPMSTLLSSSFFLSFFLSSTFVRSFFLSHSTGFLFEIKMK